MHMVDVRQYTVQTVFLTLWL